MKEPQIADENPKKVDLEEGKTYAWCACGQSNKQPFCDGSHGGTDFSPVVFKAEETKAAYLCMCKRTSNPGFCDGSHKSL
ncbi:MULTISPECIES: CDGSH iron-sulfur domain-containing protein [unclassified Ekhidna]|jgi:CDGSH-type Zn-finger protein|uniref:CDGSH iron-sulfur domain-containing protein n=1 Tax=unclassified Ekhidna TaxID=2632188 RepID=UPI0032E014F1